MTVSVDMDQVLRELEQLSSFSESAAPAVTRIVFSGPDMEARAWLKDLCATAGLLVREDGVGNMFARWNGANPELPSVGTGSHIDAIPLSGRYDGTVGVLGGLEAIRALQRAGFKPRRSIELVLFTSEEPTRFGVGCLGSRLLSGALTPERAAELRDKDGLTLDHARTEAGFSGDLASVRLPAGYFHAFVELHIEQGPLLEAQGIAIGVVTNIAAPASLRVSIRGEGGHAGSVLMPDRRDALVGAAEMIAGVESVARATGSRDSVATTGLCQVSPGAVNSIPSLVRLEIDVRDTELERRDAMVSAIAHKAREIAVQRGLESVIEILNADAPAQCDHAVINAIERACQAAGKSYVKLVSRAYHDSLFVSRIAPAGMIFIPCKGGISHRPDEYASPDDIRSGISVLAKSLAELAS